MDSACTRCSNTSQIRVSLNTTELEKLHRKLRSEFGPSVVSLEEAEELKAILALADKDIEDHDPEVACLHHRILVQAEKQRLETQRDKLCSLLSPMRKLPNETLLRVFQYTCEENLIQSYPWLSGYPPHTTLKSPAITYLPTMAISSVCFRWRELALSSPDLWANIVVETSTEVDGAAFFDTLSRHLERSGEWPLKFTLKVRDSGVRATNLPSLITLMKHAHRWKAFKYRGDELSTIHSILSPLQFPLLTELDVDIISAKELYWFKHFPGLRTLSIDLLAVPTSKIQLNHLNLYDWSVAGLAIAFRNLPSLKSLSLGYGICAHMANGLMRWRVGQSTWPNITSLATVNESLRMVLISFNFPSLDKLVIEGGHTTWPVEAFISFVSRSSCMITTLTLYNQCLSDLDLIAVLRVIPALLHLDVDESPTGYYLRQSPITPHLISTLQHQAISLAPKLHNLRLISHKDVEFDTGTFDDSGFVSMIQSRWFKPGSSLCAKMLMTGRSCIRSVVLKFTWREVDAGIYGPLRILDAEGLRVVVSGTNGVQV